MHAWSQAQYATCTLHEPGYHLKFGRFFCCSPQHELGLIMSLRLHRLSQQCMPCCSYSLMPTVQPAASATLNPQSKTLTAPQPRLQGPHAWLHTCKTPDTQHPYPTHAHLSA